MSWYPNGYVAGGKPTSERANEYAGANAVGGHIKVAYDFEQAQEAVEQRKAAIPKIRSEYWLPWAGVDGQRGAKCHIEVVRDARGRFAKLLTPQQLAVHFGLKKGSEIQKPPNTPTP